MLVTGGVRGRRGSSAHRPRLGPVQTGARTNPAPPSVEGVRFSKIGPASDSIPRRGMEGDRGDLLTRGCQR
jgi:hypothetical protein